MSNKSNRTDPMIPPTVSNAEQMVQRFERERAALLERGTELATIRASVAYKALSDDDATARATLDRINKETAEHSGTLASIDAALATARQKLEAAKQHEAKQADREQAKALRDALRQFIQHAAGVDSALEVLIASCNGMQEALTRMHRCGSTFPSDAQLQSLGGRCLLGALSKTPFRRNFETVPPLERDRSMARIAQQWGDTVERSIQQRLGDEQTNKPDEAA
jgi:hypothetical protein